MNFKFENVFIASSFLLAAFVLSKDLQIIEEYKPEDCSSYADVGDHISVHYTGYLESGTVFDSSLKDNKDAFSFVLGQGQVIQGWEAGLKGMCVNEKRKLIIPWHLAYGKQGHPPTIPPDATLTFNVELIAIKTKPIEEVIFKLLRFLAIPAAAAYAVYFLYDKYKKAPTKKEIKESKKAKKRN